MVVESFNRSTGEQQREHRYTEWDTQNTDARDRNRSLKPYNEQKKSWVCDFIYMKFKYRQINLH